MLAPPRQPQDEDQHEQERQALDGGGDEQREHLPDKRKVPEEMGTHRERQEAHGDERASYARLVGAMPYEVGHADACQSGVEDVPVQAGCHDAQPEAGQYPPMLPPKALRK